MVVLITAIRNLVSENLLGFTRSQGALAREIGGGGISNSDQFLAFCPLDQAETKNGSYHCDPFYPLKHRSQSSSCGIRCPEFQVHLGHQPVGWSPWEACKLPSIQVGVVIPNLSIHRAAVRSKWEGRYK